jgi:transposase
MQKNRRERLTLVRLFEELRGFGYAGSYDAVRRYAKTWRKERGVALAQAYVPLTFAPGEAYQFDWSHEIVVLNGATVTVKVAHMRLCHSRMPFVRAYPRETQEMVFDAHDRAFDFFKGACERGIYDNMKTAVETIFAGKDRQYNRRFLQMGGHYLVEPVACTPASGWEKGQVENQVGLVRERFFTPRLRFKSYDELNAWLLDKCVAYAKAHRHPECASRTIWEVFEDERQKLVQLRGRFDGFHAVSAAVSKTCLIRFDNNKYSVKARAVGRPVEIHAYAESCLVTVCWGDDWSVPASSAWRRRRWTESMTSFCWARKALPSFCVQSRRSSIIRRICGNGASDFTLGSQSLSCSSAANWSPLRRVLFGSSTHRAASTTSRG